MDNDKNHIWSLDDVITITEPEVTTELYSLSGAEFQYSGSNTTGILAQEISNTIDLSNITIGAVGSVNNHSYPYTHRHSLGN